MVDNKNEKTETIAARAMRHVSSKQNEWMKNIQISKIENESIQRQIRDVEKKYRETNERVKRSVQDFEENIKQKRGK